jgi:cation diffusion facilitator CzcD-associated flavoprotein CzcO
VISGVGQLSVPKYPTEIPGYETFKGTVVHSAKWDHSIDLHARVGVLGTGASAIQFTPEIAKVAKHVTVFQRSPGYVMIRGNFKYSEINKWMFRNIPGYLRLYRWFWILTVCFCSRQCPGDKP